MKKQCNKLFILFAVVFCFNTTLANDKNPAEQFFQASESFKTFNVFSYRSDQDVKNDATQKLYFFDQVSDVLRFAEVKLDKSIATEDAFPPGAHLNLNLFEDTQFLAEISSVRRNVNGTVTLMARVAEKEGYVIIATTGERTLGSIYLPSLNRYYKIISDPNTLVHYLIEMDARDRDIITPGPSLIPETTQRDLEEQKRIRKQIERDGLGPDDPANIDVMIVYTNAAQNWANSNGGGINNVIALSMANAQLVLDNSLTLMTVTLVHSSLVTYTESGSSATDLIRLTEENDGFMDEVHTWRDQYGADLVALFPFVQDTGGLAWILINKFGTPTHGFSLTRIQQAGTSYTHIHEMGHNMGCHHHKDQNVQPGPTDWWNWSENQWSAGWRWTGNDGGHYCSVMTYASGQYFNDGIDHTEVPYFSNPSITYQGVATGHPADGDNTRTLLEIKHVIAAYRESQDDDDDDDPDPETYPVTFNVSNQSGQPIPNAMITVTPDGNKSSGQPVKLTRSVRLPDAQPENRNLTLKASGNTNPGSLPVYEGYPKDDGEWINYFGAGEVNENALGLGGDEVVSWFAAIRWMPGDLGPYEDWAVSKIRIYMNDEPEYGSVVVWQGTIDNPTLMLSQTMMVGEETWVEVELFDPYHIDITQELWIGWEIGDPGDGVFPAAFTVTDGHSPKSDLLQFGTNPWQPAANFGFDVAWNIEAYIEPMGDTPDQIIIYTDASGQASFDALPGGYSYTVEKSGYYDASGNFSVSNTPVTLNVTMQSDDDPDPDTYPVTFNVNDQNGQPIPNAMITVTPDGNKSSGQPVKLTRSVRLSDTHPDNQNLVLQVSDDTREQIIIYTNTSGQASFDALPGTYGYTVEKDGYMDATGNFNVSNSPVNLNVTMQSDSDDPLVTFNVDMTDVEGFDPAQHDVYLTGSLTGWAEPGQPGSLQMSLVRDDKSPPYILYENFEGYDDFTTDLSPWITIQLTEGDTWGASHFSFPGEGTEFAWMAFNPSETDPPVDDEHPAVDGSKYAIAVQYADLDDDKWLISPEVSINQSSELSFWARSMTAVYGLERIRVLVSTSGDDPGSFIPISTEPYIEVPTDWTEYTFDLHDYAGEVIRFAINYVSHDAFFFMLDAISLWAYVPPDLDDLIYTVTAPASLGEHQYKYFSNAFGAGWDGGEWDGDLNREIEVTGPMTVHDVWGVIDDDDPDPEYFNLTFEIMNAVTGDLIPNAKITLNGDVHESGFYVFEDLLPGLYEYIVSHDDYFDQEGDLEIIDDHITIMISLIPDDTSVQDAALAELHVFPNPAQNKLFIEGNMLIGEVRLLDMMGQLVYQSKSGEDVHEIDVTDYQNGIYLLQVMVSGTVITQMVQIAR